MFSFFEFVDHHRLVTFAAARLTFTLRPNGKRVSGSPSATHSRESVRAQPQIGRWDLESDWQPCALHTAAVNARIAGVERSSASN